MASGDDPLADIMNMQGYEGLTGPNPYLQYTGQVPMAGYAGAPANAATGQPIQSFLSATAAAQAQYQQQLAAFNQQQQAQPPGATLNSNPFAPGRAFNPQGSGNQTASGQLIPNAWQVANMTGRPAQSSPGGMLPSGENYGSSTPTYIPASYAMPSMASGGRQSAAPTPPTPPDTRQAYLQALANPGTPAMPSAQILPGTSTTGPVGSGQPSVLQSFLGSQSGKQIPGGYGNESFFNTLNALQAGKQGAVA